MKRILSINIIFILMIMMVACGDTGDNTTLQESVVVESGTSENLAAEDSVLENAATESNTSESVTIDSSLVNSTVAEGTTEVEEIEELTKAEEMLTVIWNAHAGTEKFPVFGGDPQKESVEGKPKEFVINSDSEATFKSLTQINEDVYMTLVSTATLYAENTTEFQAVVLEVIKGFNIRAIAMALEYCATEGANFISGNPEKRMIAYNSDFIVYVYGNEERVNIFEQHMLENYPEMVVEISALYEK